MQKQDFSLVFHAANCAASFAAYTLALVFTHDASLATVLAYYRG